MAELPIGPMNPQMEPMMAPMEAPMEMPDFNILIPKPFSIANQPKDQLNKIKDEIMDKCVSWERRMAPFFEGYFIGADSWRIKPSRSKARGGGKTLFNSKSGETHRAAETLASVWQRMLTASDRYFAVTKRGLNPGGQPISESELYAVEGVLQEQQRVSQFKRKLLKSLRSCGLMGVAVAEEPYISLPYGPGRKHMEFTDWQFRPMIRTGFDTSVCDIVESDYIFTIDFLSKWAVRNMASLDTEHFDMAVVEKHLSEFAKGVPNYATSVWDRVRASRSRAGYTDPDDQIFECLNYHGRLEEGKSIQDAFAESIGLDQDPKFVDWSVGILDGLDVTKFHMTQYGDWRTRFEVMRYKEFEDEPIPYGIAQLGRKLQREMDMNESMTNDLLTAFTLMMWKIGKYSGYTEKQFVWEPLKMIELDDITQLAPLTPDPTAFRVALDMIGLRREDFRNIVGAQTNLQAQVTKASATESAIAQNEAMRGAGVQAEILAESLREHLEKSHCNNLSYLDEPIWVGLTGTQKPYKVNKYNLPTNVGFNILLVTDKDFRPERVRNIMTALQMVTSIRSFVPTSINAVRPLFEELFRSFDLDPRLIAQPMPAADVLEAKMNRLLSGGGLKNEVEGERADEEVGQVNPAETPEDALGGTSIYNSPVGEVQISA